MYIPTDTQNISEEIQNNPSIMYTSEERDICVYVLKKKLNFLKCVRIFTDI